MMTKPKTRRVFRYDAQEYSKGEIIKSRGDHYDRLTEDEKKVELAIQDTLPDGKRIRSTSLYTWANEEPAKQLWKLACPSHLYELEIEETDIQFIGDLEFYSDAKDAVKRGSDPESSVTAYCDGQIKSERVEVLVSKAKVLRKLFDLSEHSKRKRRQ